MGTMGWHRGKGPSQVFGSYLRDRKIIFHTDGARTCKLSLPEVLHDNGGKITWVKPRYTKLWAHTLPEGKKLTVKAGTQIIDRFWGHVRACLKHTPRKVGSSSPARKIRAAQWTYWHSKQNAWHATAAMLRDLRRDDRAPQCTSPLQHRKSVTAALSISLLP